MELTTTLKQQLKAINLWPTKKAVKTIPPSFSKETILAYVEILPPEKLLALQYVAVTLDLS